MSAQPAWRGGLLGQALALAGLWTFRLPGEWRPPEGLGAPLEPAAYPTALPHDLPILVLEGGLRVVEEATGRSPIALGTLRAPCALVPVGGDTGGIVRVASAGALRAVRLRPTELDALALAEPALGRAYLIGMREALEAQAWAMHLAARAAPLARLAALLTRIAEDRSVPEPEGLRLDGAPAPRELAVLAGVSRESAVINLAWLVREGVLGREDGRVWVRDVSRLRGIGGNDPNGA